MADAMAPTDFQDGQTQTIGGVNYVRQGGMWHPQAVYGAAPKPAAQYEAPQAAATLQRTQQEIGFDTQTAADRQAEQHAKAISAELAAKTGQEQYDQAHVAENPALVGLTGPALLAKLPPDEAPMVKAMVEGRMAPPTASALKDPQWQQRLKWANQVDPDFNEGRWQMRVKTMTDAATGRLAQANNAINTAIGHAGLLMDQAQQPGVAGHGDWPLVPDAIPTAINAVQNAVNKGNPALSVYNDTAQKLGTEEARAYQGGAPNEGDTNRYVASLSANLPLDAKRAVIHNALELFASKTAANLSQYDFGTTGGKPPLNVLDAQALHALQKYAPDVLDKYFYHGFITAPGGGTPPGSPPSDGGNNTPTGTDPTVQNVGGFRDGLTYNPQGAQGFHDAIYQAMAAHQIKDAASLTQFANDYNQKNGTDFSINVNDPQTQAAIKAANKGGKFGVSIPQMTATDTARMDQRIAADKQNPNKSAAVGGAADSITLGAFKPIIAAGDTLTDAVTGKQADYTSNLNAASGYVGAEKQAAPLPYLGGELAGGLMLPSFGARSIPEFAKVGAGYGAAYGFNSSAGQPLANKLINAGVGGVTGAALPIALGAGAKAVGAAGRGVNSLLNVLPEKTAPELPQGFDPAALASAGQQEKVTVNRAMVDPTADAKTTAVGKTMVGSPKLRSGMNQVGNQIQGRVDNLGNGGTSLEPQSAGNTVAGAGMRYITQTGAQFNRLYGSLQKATDGVKIQPAQARLQTEELINQLSELPNQNSNEISYLNGLKQDLSKPLTIDAMRSLRTKIRQDLASGNLTFGPQEARVQGIADAAASDITNGLTAAGKTNIAQRFQQVDQAYRDRMGMIQGTIQKLIGKRGQNLSGEQVFGNLKAMAGPRGDASGLSRMFEQMTPDEQKDMQATFADALGKNPKGEFSTAYLVTQAQKMPQAMRVAVFGQDGARSLNNLVTLAKAHSRVMNALGGSPTGMANDYRDWLHMGLLGGAELLSSAGGGIASHSGAGAVAGAIAPVAIKGMRDAMNARLLLNKDIQAWIKSAPATRSQRAIDVHFARLNAIAAKNPGLAADITRLKQSIYNAANSNAPMGAAAASQNTGPQQQ